MAGWAEPHRKITKRLFMHFDNLAGVVLHLFKHLTYSDSYIQKYRY